jgi:peptidoglycan/xylan/chitin deacetylase (PgdA/CDA1 family)
MPAQTKCVYLTFDDGPIPLITPWVLDLLDHYGIKATFFCVGENVVKHPEVYQEVINRGHSVGNHTYNHVQGLRLKTANFVKNTDLAANHIKSNLFRPPHGHMRIRQVLKLAKRYRIIMWDVVTRDYNQALTGKEVFNIVKRYTRNGSIIVFHDSIKAEQRMKEALPLAIEWLLAQGYAFKKIE